VHISSVAERAFARRLLAIGGALATAATIAIAGAPSASADVFLDLPRQGDGVTIFNATFTCVTNKSRIQTGALDIRAATSSSQYVHLSPASTTCLLGLWGTFPSTTTLTNRGSTVLGVTSNGYAGFVILKPRAGAAD